MRRVPWLNLPRLKRVAFRFLRSQRWLPTAERAYPVQGWFMQPAITHLKRIVAQI